MAKKQNGKAERPRSAPVENVGRMALSELVPYARNPKTHPQEQVDLLARSMERFKQTSFILVDEAGEIIAGHGRVLAAEKLGWEDIAVVRALGWTDEEKRAYRIADNELGSERLAPYDMPLLKIEVGELKLLHFDMPLLGFQNIQLENMLSGKPGKDPDEPAPELKSPPIVRDGDLWMLGKHRLLCGSSTTKESVERLFGEAKPHLMVTDPPYGVNYDPMWRERSNVNAWANARMTGEVQEDHRFDWTDAYKLFPGDVAYVWCASWFIGEVKSGLVASRFVPRSLIIWRKQHFSISRGDYHWQHEPCWYAVRKGRTAHWQGDRKQTTIWDILGFQVAGGHRDEAKTGHGTQKPLECMERPIRNNSKHGDGVYDPFVGSGTTIIAAEVSSRQCFAIDIDPAYVEVSIRRWQEFTGKTATLEDGRTFDQVQKDRAGKHANGSRPKPIPSKQPRGPSGNANAKQGSL